MDYTTYDQVALHLLHTIVCDIDFSIDMEDGSQIGQRTVISKISVPLSVSQNLKT